MSALNGKWVIYKDPTYPPGEGPMFLLPMPLPIGRSLKRKRKRSKS